ncbi:hypothetical protein T06_5991 [Trichinella sp. T6]|nr:hypothetical protein T06_5991 [Trichinella sp. T6]
MPVANGDCICELIANLSRLLKRKYHWLVLSRPCHKAALTVRKTHFVHVSIKAKTRISIATAGSTFIHHLRNQDQGHLSADHSDNDLLPSVSTLRTTAG